MSMWRCVRHLKEAENTGIVQGGAGRCYDGHRTPSGDVATGVEFFFAGTPLPPPITKRGNM